MGSWNTGEKVQVTFILVLAGIAIVALLVGVVLADQAGTKAAIGVATACVAVLATLVSRLGKDKE